MKAWIIAGIAATLLSGCYEKDRIAALEAENAQLKAKLAKLEETAPTGINIENILKIGRERLGDIIPEPTPQPGDFTLARSTLAVVLSIDNSLKNSNALTSEDEIEQKILGPLRVVRDTWPALSSPAGQARTRSFDSCRDLPVVYAAGVKLAQAGDKENLTAASKLEHHLRTTCMVMLKLASTPKK